MAKFLDNTYIFFLEEATYITSIKYICSLFFKSNWFGSVMLELIACLGWLMFWVKFKKKYFEVLVLSQ